MKKEIIIDGERYLHESEVKKAAPSKDGMPFCIVRTYSAGVFAGYIAKREGKEVTMRDAIRIWYWAGANSLSQLAVDGPLKPDECKFAIPVPEVLVTEAIEIIHCTAKAKEAIEGVPSWVMQ